MRALEAAGRCAVMAEIFQGLDPMAIAEVEQAAIQYWRRRSGRALFNKVSVKQAFYRRLKKAA